MDKNELFNEFYKSIEAKLTSVSGSHWNIIKNATIGKELITVAATVYFEYFSRLQGVNTVFNYKTLPASGLVDLANFINIPLSWIRPTTLYVKNISKPIGKVEQTIGSSTFIGMCRFPGEVVRLYKYSSVETINKSTIQIGDTTVRGFKIDKAIIPFLSIKDTHGNSSHLYDLVSNSGIDFINLKDKSIFIEDDRADSVQIYVPDTDPSDVSADLVKNAGYELISVVQGEESDNVARDYIQQYVNFSNTLASEQSIIEAVNADINVVDCKVSVENKSVRVYCKPSNTWKGGLDYLSMELNTRGIIGYNYATILANNAVVTLLIKGSFDSSQRTAIESMLAKDYSYNNTKFDWIPSILELKSKIEAVTGEYNFDLSFKVTTQIDPNIKYKPIEGSIKLKQVDNGWIGGYDKDGIIYTIPNMGYSFTLLFSGSQIGYWSTAGEEDQVAGTVSYQGDISVPGVILYCNTAKMLGIVLSSAFHSYTTQGIVMAVNNSKVTIYNSESFTQKNTNIGVPIIRTYNLDSSYVGLRNDKNLSANHLAVSKGSFVSRPLCYIQSYLYCNEVDNKVSTVVRYSTAGVREKLIQVGELGGCRGCHYDGRNLYVFYDGNPSEAVSNAIALVLFNLGEIDQYAQIYPCDFQIAPAQAKYTLFDIIEIVTGEIYVVIRDSAKTNLLYFKTTGFVVTDNKVKFNTVLDLGSSKYKTDGGDSYTYQVVKGGIIVVGLGTPDSVPTLHKDDGTTVTLSNLSFYNCNNPQSVGTVNYDTGEISISDSWSVQFRSVSLIKNDNTYITLSSTISYE